MKKKILFFQFAYLPGYKAGGSLRTLANLIEQLDGEFDIQVVCLDRDPGDNLAYQGIKVNEWQPQGSAQVMYLSQPKLKAQVFRKIIISAKPDLIYLNSFFHPVFSRQPLFLRRLGSIPKIPFIIAPRGEFSAGAIRLKSLKKHLYVFLAKHLGLVAGVTWHASNEQEASDIRGLFGSKVQVKIAPDLPTMYSEQDKQLSEHQKEKGTLKIIFLSRISRKKNLSFALDLLKELTGNISFDIYGPIDDHSYWQECQQTIRSLPPNIICSYCHDVEYRDVISVMQKHDLFFLPTLGENFGYVYLEALVAGCPILLSDQTPWHDLQAKGVGWDIPLPRIDLFKQALQRCVDMGSDEHNLWSQRANKYGLELINDQDVLAKNKQMFYSVLEGN